MIPWEGGWARSTDGFAGKGLGISGRERIPAGSEGTGGIALECWWVGAALRQPAGTAVGEGATGGRVRGIG